jgi:hypothetical protein
MHPPPSTAPAGVRARRPAGRTVARSPGDGRWAYARRRDCRAPRRLGEDAPARPDRYRPPPPNRTIDRRLGRCREGRCARRCRPRVCGRKAHHGASSAAKGPRLRTRRASSDGRVARLGRESRPRTTQPPHPDRDHHPRFHLDEERVRGRPRDLRAERLPRAPVCPRRRPARHPPNDPAHLARHQRRSTHQPTHRRFRTPPTPCAALR